MLVDCGFTAITKQGIGSQAHPKMIAPVDEHQNLMLSNMTQVWTGYALIPDVWNIQEIGFVEPISSEGIIDYTLHPVGSLLKLIPYHSCASAACHPTYYVHDNQGIIGEQWTPCRGWWWDLQTSYRHTCVGIESQSPETQIDLDLWLEQDENKFTLGYWLKHITIFQQCLSPL